ncbi:MAG: hypothetical protein R3199_06860 [Gemmatimonadota bacterium]|nr:hypothetical protein [Gemmatimonadota bacterium]
MRFSVKIARTLMPLLAAIVLVGCGARAPRGDRPASQGPPLGYVVRVAEAATAGYHVTLTAERLRRDSLDFVLPAWTPGRYGLGVGRPVVENFAARDGRGRPVPARRTGATSWRLYLEDDGFLTLSYRVVPGPESEPLPFRTQLGLRSGYALGAGIFGTIVGYESRPITVAFDLPSDWRVHTPLRPRGPGRFAVPRFGALLDAPFVLGERAETYRLFVKGRSHQVAVQGADRSFAPDSLLRLVEETIEHGIRFYGAPPFQRYLFAFHFVEPESAGLGSTGQSAGSVYFLPRLDGRRLREAGVGQVLLHQYLHAWYPGSFGPDALMRPRLWTPPRTEDLWFVEGSAEYYARLLPVRYGPSGRTAFYASIEELLTRWYDLGGGSRIAPAALMRSARRSGDDRAVTRLLLGGTLSAMLIDLTIREETRGLRGLDQALYYLQRRSPRGGYRPGRMWPEVAEALGVPPQVLGPLTGSSTLSIDAGLARAGLRARERTERRRTLGARLLVGERGAFVVDEVEPGGTAASAGLREGDRLRKIGPTPVAPGEVVATRFALTKYVREARTGDPITFEVERGGIERQLRGVVRESRTRRVELVEDPSPPAVAMLVRSSLFRPTGAAPGD